MTSSQSKWFSSEGMYYRRELVASIAETQYMSTEQVFVALLLSDQSMQQ